jgi:hypothetical protein
VPHPRQHLARVMAQVPQANCMRIRGCHTQNVSQFCGYTLLARVGLDRRSGG